MKNKNCGGIFIFEDPEEFLKVMEDLQEQYNKFHDDGDELDDY